MDAGTIEQLLINSRIVNVGSIVIQIDEIQKALNKIK